MITDKAKKNSAQKNVGQTNLKFNSSGVKLDDSSECCDDYIEAI
jgi:hypothetical protein